jgi:RimJ/RimL family protein N-acetyltransferase
VDSFLTFETDRLWLRPTSLDDAAFVLDLVNTPKWLEFVGDRQVKNIADARKYISKRILPQLQRLGHSNYTVIRKADEAKMGVCGLYDREGMEGFDLGFAFLPEFEKQGYAFEAASILAEAGRKYFGLDRIFAYTTENHRDSRHLLEKLGMNCIGTICFPGEQEELLKYELSYT